jgi:hypothetical protein
MLPDTEEGSSDNTHEDHLHRVEETHTIYGQANF